MPSSVEPQSVLRPACEFRSSSDVRRNVPLSLSRCGRTGNYSVALAISIFDHRGRYLVFLVLTNESAERPFSFLSFRDRHRSFSLSLRSSRSSYLKFAKGSARLGSARVIDVERGPTRMPKQENRITDRLGNQRNLRPALQKIAGYNQTATLVAKQPCKCRDQPHLFLAGTLCAPGARGRSPWHLGAMPT